MGEVYRARDLKLNRDVALKILPESLANDAERMSRFRREAQVLAALNHANIAAIYGIEDSGATHALVMELVEGETLAERIARGRIPLEEALPVARQIADGLEWAHEKGITHRDLKPANIKLTPEGNAKLLDFGLAKVLDAGPVASSDPSASPTFTSARTEPGLILGTAAYMSPEQAKGKAVDRRTDIWAFGCVLFEMLTGQRAFDGETVTDALAAVVRAEPEWPRLPASTPLRIRELLRRCLQKDPRQRQQSIGDVRIVIEETLANKSDAVLPVAPGLHEPADRASRWLVPVLATLLVVALVTAALGWWKASRSAERPVQRFEMALGPAESFNFEGQSPVAISPDGKRVAYVLRHGPSALLYIRALDQLKAEAVAGSEGAIGPFFSPDGSWIGFFARARLLKVPATGGSIVDLCPVEGNTRGAAWGTDGYIYFVPGATVGLQRIAAGGGQPQPFTALRAEAKERTHRWPQIMPDGKHVLFTVGSADSPEFYDDSEIDAVSLETGQRAMILKGASRAAYVSPGHLIYARGGALYSIGFDPVRLQTNGAATPVVTNVAGDTSSGAAFFDMSGGDLLYVTGPSINEHGSLIWANENGKIEEVEAPLHHYRDLTLSPDGTQVAFAIAERTQDIWVYDFRNRTLNRRTFEGQCLAPVWTPDGKHLLYQSSIGGGRGQINIIPSDGSSPAQALSESERSTQRLPMSVSPDGKFATLGSASPSSINLLSLTGDHQVITLSGPNDGGMTPMFSPDGRWIAYTAAPNADFEVFVQPYPPTGGRWQASSQGGHWPRWSGDGKQLFFVDGNNDIIRVTISTKNGFQAESAKLFYKGIYMPPGSTSNYAVSYDGTRVLMMKPADGPQVPSQMVIVLNWAGELSHTSGTAGP
jgi:serine/threonine-protein kinase